MRKKNYTFWLLLTYVVLALICAGLIILFHQSLTSIIINIAMFMFVAMIFAFAIGKFNMAGKFQKALSSAIYKIKEDAKSDSRYLWKQYKKDKDGGLFPDNILSRQYQKFTAEMLRLEQFNNADYKCSIEDYINKEYIDASLKKNILNLIPGTMTGLGILGTFVGLSFGLQFFNTGTAAEITESIAPLMEGIKVAFHTSIYGLVFSLVYSFVYRATMEEVYMQLDEFLSVFNTYVVGDAINDNESNMREMLQQIPDSLGDKIGQQMSESLTPVVYNMNKTMMDFAQTIADSQAKGMQGLVDEFINKMDQSLGGNLSRLGRTLNETIELQKGNNAYAQTIMDRMAQVSGNVNDVNTLSVRIIDNMNGYITEVNRLQGVITENYNITYRQMEALKDHEERMQGYVHALTAHEKEVNENIKKELNEVIRMSHVFTEEIQGTSQQLTDTLNSARIEIDAAAKELAAASTGLDERLSTSLKETFRMFDSNMAQITTHLSTTVSEIEKTTDRVPEVVLAAYNSMKQSFDNMQAETNNLIRSLENINKQQ